jgi:rod shape-determining protein MreC
LKNIFLFIRRYLTFLSFLLLQVIALVLLSNASKTHQAFFHQRPMKSPAASTRAIQRFRDYFGLKETNRQLAEENARLKNMLASNFVTPDSTAKTGYRYTGKRYMGRIRKFTYLPAKVVIGNTYTLQSNFLTLERGSAQGVKKEWRLPGLKVLWGWWLKQR